MLRQLRCKLGLHHYEWFTTSRDGGAGWITLDTYGRRTCCDNKVIHVDREHVSREKLIGPRWSR